MEYLVPVWPFFKPVLVFRPMVIFLDYDGTLAPIASTPQAAVLSAENRTLLEQLSQSRKSKVAVVSGRAIADLKVQVGLDNIVYVGNHGMEIEGPGMIFFENLASLPTQHALQKLKEELTGQLRSVSGVLLEDKGITMSVHYRQVSAAKIPAVEKKINRICKPYSQRGEVQVTAGKKVLEIRPQVSWNKGSAVSWLLKYYSMQDGRDSIPFYVGDDATDEDAFAVLGDLGVSVCVGEKSSQARYYLKDSGEVTWLLRELLLLSA